MPNKKPDGGEKPPDPKVVSELEAKLRETKQALEETKRRVEELDAAIKRLKEGG